MRAPAELASPVTALAVAGLALVAASWSADAGAHPKRRPGLWEVRSTGAEALGMPATRFCVGDGTDTEHAHLDRASGQRGSCSLGTFVRAGEAWVAESVCREGRSTVISRAVASGDFETAYRIDTLVTQGTPAGGGRRDDREAVVARWLGPCEPGQRAGDLVIPGMGTLNMEDGTFLAEPRPRPRRAAPPR